MILNESGEPLPFISCYFGPRFFNYGLDFFVNIYSPGKKNPKVLGDFIGPFIFHCNTVKVIKTDRPNNCVICK